MRAASLLFLAVLAPSVVLGHGVRFLRSCGVYSEPSLISRFTCERTRGAIPKRATRHDSAFVRVEFDDCVGFVPNGCLGLAGDTSVPRAKRVSRALSSDDAAPPWKLGVVGDIGVPFAKVPYDSSLGHGFAFGFGAELYIPLAERWQILVSPSYESMSLSHSVGNSTDGYIKDYPGSFSQHYSFLGLKALAAVALARAPRPPAGTSGDLDWWLEGGGQLLVPLTASQSQFGATTTLANKDRPALALLGVRGDYPLSPSSWVSGALHLFYNVAASGGSRVFGARLSIALQLGL